MTGIFESIWAFGIAAATLWSIEFFGLIAFVLIISLGTRAKYHSYWGTGIIFVLTFAFLVLSGALHPITFLYQHPWWSLGIVLLYGSIGLVWTCFRWIKFLRSFRKDRDKLIRDYVSDLKNRIKFKIAQDNQANQKNTTKTRNTSGGFDVYIGVSDQVINIKSPWEDITNDERENWVSSTLSTSNPPPEPKLLTEDLLSLLSGHSYDSDFRNRDHYGEKLDELPTWRNHKKNYGAYFFYWPFDALIYVLSELLADVWKFIGNQIQVFMDGIAKKLTGGPVNMNED